MDSNTHSNQAPAGWSADPTAEPPAGPSEASLPGLLAGLPMLADGSPDWLTALTVVLDGLASQDLDQLSAVVRAHRVPALQRLTDRLRGQCLKELAGVDARGEAGADQDQPAPPRPAGCATGDT